MNISSKIKEIKKVFVSIASNLTRLEIETDRYIKNVVFATSFFHLVADKKRLRMFLTQFKPCIVQAPVVQRLDNAIHRINHYPADSVVCFVHTYPLDSDLSGG